MAEQCRVLSRVTAPSATPCLTDALRLVLASAAYVLHHALRTHPLAAPPVAAAQPSTRLPPPLHSEGDGGQTVRGADFPPPAAVLARRSALGSGPRAALRRPRPRVAHVLRRSGSPAGRSCAPGSPGAPATRRGRSRGREREVETALRRRGACRGGSRGPLACRDDDTLERVLHPSKSPEHPCAQELALTRLFSTPVYENSRLSQSVNIENGIRNIRRHQWMSLDVRHPFTRIFLASRAATEDEDEDATLGTVI